MEEKKELEVMELETETSVDDAEEYTESGKGKLLVGLGALAVAGIAAVAYKGRGKLEERRIEKLRKKGYVIYKEDEVEVRDAEDDDFFEDEADEKTE